MFNDPNQAFHRFYERLYENNLLCCQKECLNLSKAETMEELVTVLEKRSNNWNNKVHELYTQIINYIRELKAIVKKECSRETLQQIYAFICLFTPSKEERIRLDTLLNTVNNCELESLLLSILRKLLNKWEHRRSSDAVDREIKAFLNRSNFLSTRTDEELKLMLLILSFEERQPRQNNLTKEEMHQIQIKVVTEFWKKLKNHASGNIGDVPIPLLKYLRVWREKARKVENDAENLLKSIENEWNFFQKLCTSN